MLLAVMTETVTESSVPEKVPTRLARARELRRISQSEAARRARVTQSYWSTVERGDSTPTIDIAQRMASALGFTTDELWPPEKSRG